MIPPTFLIIIKTFHYFPLISVNIQGLPSFIITVLFNILR